ncbi:MAG: nucleotide sugar dehydrogenase [Nocardioides sp.]
MMDPVARFRTERWTAGVIGLGYVGLPLAMAASEAGLGVIGYDVAQGRIDTLAGGSSHVGDVSADQLGAALALGAVFTTDATQLRHADAIFIAVPSPLGRNRQPDMSFIEAAARLVAEVARPGQLISLESTTYPGTTEEVMVPAIEAAGLTLDEDVFVCFSPERVDPGNNMRTVDIPKVVGGVTQRSGEVAAAAYGRLVTSVHVTSTAHAAELTKLVENTYRAVNIALVNELAQVAHAFDVDLWEVIDAAATKPFGFQPFYPGPGVGGHCIPLDPQYLAWRAREKHVATRFIDLAEDINSNMPNWVVDRVRDALNDRGLPVRGTRILLVGMAYKRNISDDRESPSADVMRHLDRLGADLGLFDPYVAAEDLARHGHPIVDSVEASDWSCAIVLTDHDGVDYAGLAKRVPVVFDTRGIYRRKEVAADNVISL